MTPDRSFVRRPQADLLFPGRGIGQPARQILALLQYADPDALENICIHSVNSFIIFYDVIL
jgi:hypothetical protein